MTALRLSLACLILPLALPAAAQTPYSERIQADQPAAYWSFNEHHAQPTQGEFSIRSLGQAKLSAGAAAPDYPLFAKGNQALYLDGKTGYLRIQDPGEKSLFDFDAGDSITIEAWVAPEDVARGFP